ncbi:odorant receptor 85f-like isoform X4 [Microplitis mediator]|uniref:odorant receptor 85f-like isoform X4 n=1 Tax=Microplitis mediator TaxID=375433 RepID=UPI00255297BD|nr:odorant receptor 85f-like isoform X4 [Microplitis mediator]
MTTILPQSFFILTCIGLWRPVDWQGWKCKLYDAYSYFVVVTNFAFSLSQLLDIILVRTSINELTNNMTMLLVMVTACGKILGILCNRNEIIQIIKSLEEKPFKPRDQYEIDIRNKYIHISSTYAQVGFDTLFPGMMMYVSAQTNILQYRFKKVIKALEKINLKNSADQVKNHKDAEKNIITEWVECHIAVLSFSDYVYEIFSKPVFLQYCSSSIMLCGTVYYFSSIPMDYVECISTMVFIIGTILQIFMCCMSAHQLTLQFADLNDAMYNTDWFNLSINAKKSMIIIVLKTFQPVVFMSGYIVTLSIESFKSVMKLSYSIYNVLQ